MLSLPSLPPSHVFQDFLLKSRGFEPLLYQGCFPACFILAFTRQVREEDGKVLQGGNLLITDLWTLHFPSSGFTVLIIRGSEGKHTIVSSQSLRGVVKKPKLFLQTLVQWAWCSILFLPNSCIFRLSTLFITHFTSDTSFSICLELYLNFSHGILPLSLKGVDFSHKWKPKR